LTGSASAEWFALHSPPAQQIGELSQTGAEQLGQRLRQLHDACCRPFGDPFVIFGTSSSVCIRDVTAIRLVKRLSQRERVADLQRLLHGLEPNLRPAAKAGYAGMPGQEPRAKDRRRLVGVA